MEVNGLVTLLGYRTYFQLQNLVHKLQHNTLNSLHLSCTQLARSHAEYLTLLQLVADLETQTQLSHETHETLLNLTAIYGLWTINRNYGEFIESNALQPHQLAYIRHALPDLYKKIMPQVIGLTDAFEVPESFLNSDLGAYDGNVYERIMESVKNNPLNNEPVVSGYKEFIQPIVEGRVKKSKL